MTPDDVPLDEIRGALAGITRRLDQLADRLAHVGTPEAGPPAAPGEPLDEAERRRLGRLVSLLAVATTTGHDETLLLAVDRAIHRAGADCAAVYLPTAAGDLEAAAHRGLGPDPPRIGAGEGIVGRALVEGAVIRGNASHQTADRLLREHGLAHAVAVPVALPGRRAQGVLVAGRRRPAAFDGEALETLVLVADRLAVGSAEPRPTAETPPPLDLADDLDLARVAGAVAREAARRLGVPRVAVLVPDGDRLTLLGGVGVPADAPIPARDTPALAGALETGTPWTPGAGGDASALEACLGAPTRLVASLRLDTTLVGLVLAGGPREVAPSALAPLLRPAALALRNARLHAEAVAAVRELRGTARPPETSAPPPVRDFANLLAVVLARIALVRERATDSTVVRELGIAEEAAWRAAEAVRNFLGFAPGDRDAALLPVDLPSVVHAAVEVVARRWAERRASPLALTLDLQPVPPVRGNPDDLREALDRILENAAEAVSGGGTISVRTRWDGSQGVEVTVEDAGPGMDETVRARVLEPFFSTKGPGRLGLGLPVAQAIVTRHRGVLDLVSVPGQGTTVRVAFPTASGARRATAPSEDTGPVRVLVVEDETSIREALVALLRRQGHHVFAAADGREGVAVVEREPVDVVFTDLAVPGRSGLEVARAVKRLRPGTPVVLVTAWPGRLDTETLQSSGIDRLIEKPVGAPEVLAALDAALALRRAAHP